MVTNGINCLMGRRVVLAHGHMNDTHHLMAAINQETCCLPSAPYCSLHKAAYLGCLRPLCTQRAWRQHIYHWSPSRWG